jgi:hypothetical protein
MIPMETIRSHPDYSKFWRAAGRPIGFPVPRPYFEGPTGHGRYITIDARTNVTTVTVAPGQVLIMMCDPWRQVSPMVGSTTLNGIFVATGRHEALKDKGEHAWTTTANWVRTNPASYTQDAACIKSG